MRRGSARGGRAREQSDAARPRVGDVVVAPLSDLHPTQSTLGFDEICSKLGRYTLGKNAPEAKAPSDPRTRTKTAVIGPGSQLYLTDGHHTFTTLAEMADGGPDARVKLRLVADLSDATPDVFWATMRRHGWTHLKDAEGRPIAPADLPASLALADFDDDELRSLLYFARGIGYRATDVPFQEFHWAEWLRSESDIDLRIHHEHDAYLDLVERVTRAQASLRPDARISGDLTAAELGALPRWNDGAAKGEGAFGRLSAPYESARPGRLAYALEFRQLHGIHEPIAAPNTRTARRIVW